VTVALAIALVLVRQRRLALFVTVAVGGAASSTGSPSLWSVARDRPVACVSNSARSSSHPAFVQARDLVALGVVVASLTRARTARVAAWTLLAVLVLAVESRGCTRCPLGHRRDCGMLVGQSARWASPSRFGVCEYRRCR